MRQHTSHFGSYLKQAFRLLPFTFFLPIFIIFFMGLNGPNIHDALASAVSSLFSAGQGPLIRWILVVLGNAAIFWYLAPVFYFQAARSCDGAISKNPCLRSLHRLNRLGPMLVLLSVAVFMFGTMIASRDSDSAHFFTVPKAYSLMEACSSGFLTGVFMYINIGNLLFPIRRAAILVYPDLEPGKTSLYKKIFLIIIALVFFMVFQVFSSSSAFFNLGAGNVTLPGDAGGALASAADAFRPGGNQELKGVLSVFYLRICILLFLVTQLFWQIKAMIMRPLGTIRNRLSALNADSPDASREIEIVHNDEFASVYKEINKLIKKQQAELVVSRDQLDSITENAADPIIVYGPNCSVLSFNPAAERYFGYGKDEVIGKDLRRLLAFRSGGSDAADAEAAIAAASAGKAAGFGLAVVLRGAGEGGEERPAEESCIEVDDLFPEHDAEAATVFKRHRAFAKDGRSLYFEAHAAKSSSTEKTVYTVILRDVRHQIEIEETLKKAKVAAENANRMKSEFLANMSHELRTPLNAVLGFTQLLGADKTLNSRQLEKVDIISRSGEHLLALINDILDISKIEAGKVETHLEAFDLIRFLDDMKEMFALRCKKKGLSLYVEQTSELPRWVDGDLGKLRQVVINLVGNAVKFTSEGGVGITVGRDADKIRFSVIDSGKGIPADELDLIVEPFTQSSITDHEGGTGLGLAISSRFIEMMGGKLEIASEVGKGSSFSFAVALPESAVRPEAENPDETPIAVKKGSKVTVLVVDDKVTNRLVLKEMLESAGFDTLEAENGKEAVERALEYKPAIVFMDIRMPEMDGYEAVTLLKARPEGKAMRIFALTASAFKHDEEKIAAAGFDGFLAKPFKRTALFRLIRDKTDIELEYEKIPTRSENAPLPDFASLDFGKLRDVIGAEGIGRLAEYAAINDFAAAKNFAEDLRGRSDELAVLIRHAADGFDEKGLENIVSALKGAEPTALKGK